MAQDKTKAANTITGGPRTELLLLGFSLLLLCLGLLAAIGANPFNSDDVAQQNAVAHLTLQHPQIIDLQQNNYVIKFPIYGVINLLPISPQARLIATILLLNLAGLAIFYLAAKSLARTLKYVWVAVIAPFAWLCMTGLQFASILANPNSRNLEVGLIFAALALMADWYQSESRIWQSWGWAKAVAFTTALGLLLYNDPYFGYMIGLPVLVFFGLRWLLFGKDRKALYLALAMVAAFLFEQIWRLLLFAIGVHSGQPNASFVALPDLLRNLGLFVQGVLEIFQANIFGQSVAGLHGVATEVNFFLLLLLFALPVMPFLRSQKVVSNPWKAMILLLPFATFLGFTMSGMVFNLGADHYLVILPFEAALVYMVSIAEAPTVRIRTCLIGLIGVATVLNLATSAQLYAERSSNLNSNNQAIVRAVESHHLTKGFADYWDAGINQYYSNNEVEFIQAGCSPADGVDVNKLLLNEGELQLPARTSFYLLDPIQTRCTEADLLRFFGRPASIVRLAQGNKLLIYNYDITGKINAR